MRSISASLPKSQSGFLRLCSPGSVPSPTPNRTMLPLCQRYKYSECSCVHIYVHVYVCICVCVCVCVIVCLYVCMSVCAYPCTCFWCVLCCVPTLYLTILLVLTIVLQAVDLLLKIDTWWCKVRSMVITCTMVSYGIHHQ